LQAAILSLLEIKTNMETDN